MAQLVARYLGVVEAARSSRVTQTISSVHNRPEGLVWTLDCFLPEILFFIVAVQILSTAFSLGSGGIFYHLIQRRNRFIPYLIPLLSLTLSAPLSLIHI